MLGDKRQLFPMPADRWEHLWRLFHQALALTSAERRRFLKQQSDKDAELANELHSLLQAHEQQHTLLDRPPLGLPPMQAGKRIGPWKLLRELGAGGMGVVWLGERADGAYEKLVALKLLSPGWHSPALTARFQRERQILARLQHPNIATLLDGGTAESAQPYLVMEYVEGIPLNEFVRDQRLSVNARLELFCRICRAVDHAHRRLVLHRDLKPANILVSDDGTPKLLDFGIARLLEPDTDQPQTLPAERRLTPDYASPELLRGESVGTETDCYALGVTLFEMLTGSLPRQLGGLSAQQALVQFNEQRVTAPSQKARQAGNAALASRLRGDLDRIVGKAIHPDPERRYTSVRDLVRDIDCHLRGLPVGARPDTWRYRTTKFLSRHPLGVAASVLAISLLLALTVALGLESSRLADALQQARQQTQRAEALSGFLLDLFSEADPEEHAGSPLTVEDVMARGTQRVTESFRDQPALKATFLVSLGRIQTNLGNFERAESLFSQANSILHTAPNAEATLRARAELAFGEMLQQTRRHEAAGESALRALEILDEKPGAQSQQRLRALLLLATVQQFQGNMQAAEETMKRIAESDAMPDGALAGEIDLRRGALAWTRGDFDEARRHYESAREKFEMHFGERHTQVARARNAVAAANYRMGRFEAAEAAYRRTLESRKAIYGPEHPKTAETMAHLGALLYDRGAIAEALPLTERALNVQRSTHGPQSPIVANTLNNLALTLSDLGRYEEAESHFQEAIRINRAAHESPHARVAGNLSNLGLLYLEERAFEKAKPVLDEALAIQRELYPDGHAATGFTLNHQGRAALGLGRHEEAREYFDRALELRRRVLEPRHPHIADSLFWRGRLAISMGDFSRAMEWLGKAVEIRRERLGPDDPRTVEAAGTMGAALLHAGQDERGYEMAEDSLKRLADEPVRRQRVSRALSVSQP